MRCFLQWTQDDTSRAPSIIPLGAAEEITLLQLPNFIIFVQFRVHESRHSRKNLGLSRKMTGWDCADSGGRFRLIWDRVGYSVELLNLWGHLIFHFHSCSDSFSQPRLGIILGGTHRTCLPQAPLPLLIRSTPPLSSLLM